MKIKGIHDATLKKKLRATLEVGVGTRNLQIVPRRTTANSGGTKQEGRNIKHPSDTQNFHLF
jgi:hypothetical protein